MSYSWTILNFQSDNCHPFSCDEENSFITIVSVTLVKHVSPYSILLFVFVMLFCLLITCWERADFLVLSCVFLSLSLMLWYLIVSISDHCLLMYLSYFHYLFFYWFFDFNIVLPTIDFDLVFTQILIS